MSEEMTMEEAIDRLSVITFKDSYPLLDKALKMVIAALKTEPCKDTISRQAAIDEIMGRRPDAHYPDYYASIIRNLPSVHAEPKTGHWIIISPTDMYCSVCNEIEHLDTSRRFCAYCGTKMVEPQESDGSDADSN